MSVAIRLLVVTGCLLLAPGALGASEGKEAGQKAYPVKVLPDVAYNESKDADPDKHRLDLYLPEGKKDYPVLFFIHGGGWTAGKRKAFAKLGQSFAQHGIGTVTISYRLSPGVTHPAHIKDVAQAFDWTYRNISQYGGRKDEIFVSGHSAGGHLAALLATDSQYLKKYDLSLSNIKGVIPISGVFTIAPGKMVKIFGKSPEVATQASPLTHVTKKCPPFLIFYAEQEIKGLGESARAFAAALQKQGVPVRCEEIKDRNHGSIAFSIPNEGDPVAQKMRDFIHRSTSASPNLFGD